LRKGSIPNYLKEGVLGLPRRGGGRRSFFFSSGGRDGHRFGGNKPSGDPPETCFFEKGVREASERNLKKTFGKGDVTVGDKLEELENSRCPSSI